MIFSKKSSIGLPNIHNMSFSFHPTYFDQSAPCPSLSYIYYIFVFPFYLQRVLKFFVFAVVVRSVIWKIIIETVNSGVIPTRIISYSRY